jgi:hypothetical protein
MRIAIVLVALSAPARADECSGEAASTVDCNALDKRGAMSLAMGWRADSFDPNGHTFDVKHVGYANTIGSFDGKNLGPIRGNGFFLDVRVHATPHWYAGVDLGAAWGDPPTASFSTRGGEMLGWDSAMVFAMAGVVGARLPLGRVSLRGELVAGLHGAALVAKADSLSAETAAPMVQPRLAADVWLDHFWVVEAFAGPQVFGLGLAFHSQAFDGHD